MRNIVDASIALAIVASAYWLFGEAGMLASMFGLFWNIAGRFEGAFFANKQPRP